MSATRTSSVLKSLEIDSAQVEALSEPDLCELIGFIEDDSRTHTMSRDDATPAAVHSPPVALPGVRPAASAPGRE
jgi:hypothetical protein